MDRRTTTNAEATGRPASALRLVYGGAGRLEWLGPDNRTETACAMADFTDAIPCFTPGTAIATQSGPRLAEDLRAGDRVITRDHGAVDIAWTGARDFDWRALGANPVLAPVRIAAGALGEGLPERDLLLSPNHRLLMRGRPAPDASATEVLISAATLTGREGIARAAVPSVRYIQIAFARHEAILSDGVWSESFHVAEKTLLAMPPALRSELLGDMSERTGQGQEPVRIIAESAEMLEIAH